MSEHPDDERLDERRGEQLSIGDLARRTGLTTSALRMWEDRHGFPVPQRLPGGHRRYTEDDVALVRRVAELRSEGVRLDDAVDEARATREPVAPSVFATLRQRHPVTTVQRMTKTTLIAMSWAIEDEVVARADDPVIWGAFQQERFYRPSSRRWRELSRVARGVTVFADFGGSDAGASPRRVDLRADSPMHREWAVVVDSETFPVALSAFELPGQTRLPDRSRTFEATWTLDPIMVRDAARVCASVARDRLGEAPGAYAVPPALRSPVPIDAEAVNALLTRTAGYIDRFVER